MLTIFWLSILIGTVDVDEAAQARLDAAVTLHFPEEAPGAKVLEAIKTAADSNLKIEVAPDASEKWNAARIKIDVEGIPLKSALTMVARQAGLIYTVEGSGLTIAIDPYREPDLKELEERMKPVDTTVYAPGYTEEKFLAIEVGLTESEVHKRIGRPLHETRSRPQIDWYYGPPTLRVIDDGGIFDTSGAFFGPYSYSIARAHPDGKIFEILGGYFDDVPRSLIGASLDEMKKRYGEPVAIHSNKASRTLVYSGPKASGSFRSRTIGVDSAGKVVDRIARFHFE